MSKTFYLCFTVLCLAVCLVLLLGFIVVGPSDAGANEVLSAAPALVGRDGKVNIDYLSEYADYFNDRFFLRQELISTFNRLTVGVFGTSVNEDVIVGSDDWLYYGSTVSDYTGTDSMSEREIYSVAANLAIIQEYCLENGTNFLFTAAPNKNSIYPEYMPNLGEISAKSDVERLYEKLAQANINYVNLHETFENTEEILYFKHDSHWNSKGAALAADVINCALGVESRYYLDDFSTSEGHSGDLFEMLYPAFEDDERNPVYGGEIVCDYGDGLSKADSIILNTVGAGEGSLLCYRDSFGELLHPYLADSFAEAKFSRATAYDLTESYDNVVIELVERNLDYLISYVPIMPAPEREISPVAEGSNCYVSTSGAPTEGGYVLWRGSLGDVADDESPVYIIFGGTAYECFLLQDGGFAAYVPERLTQPEGVAYYIDGVLSVGKVD